MAIRITKNSGVNLFIADNSFNQGDWVVQSKGENQQAGNKTFAGVV
jgi:hypothetical protein